jgi:hypothetical protein
MHTLTLRVVTVVALCSIVFLPRDLSARDDGRFADSPLKTWFDKLASGKGLCCSFADGVSVQDVDWDMQGNSYRVRIDGKWVVVPDTAVVPSLTSSGPLWSGRIRTTRERRRSVVSCRAPARSGLLKKASGARS